MRFIPILIKEGRKEDLRKKYIKGMDPVVLDWILNISDLADFNHKYTDFVLKTLPKDSEELEDDVQSTIDAIKDFDKYQSQLEKKDINQYNSYLELEKALYPVRVKEKEKELEKQVDKIYEDDKFLVVRPKTLEASCKYGSNTKWCTTSRTGDHFQRYTTGSQSLYYIINKANSKNENYSKIAIHFDNSGNPRYYDTKDAMMTEREINVLNYAFPELIEKINEDYEKIAVSSSDTFLKEVFNSKGAVVRKSQNYLGTKKSLNIYVEGFNTINDMGPGHAEGEIGIFLDTVMLDGYIILITFRAKDRKTFRISVGFMSKDSEEHWDFVDLGLEGWGFDSNYLIDGTSARSTAESLKNQIANKVLDHIKENEQLLQKVVGSSKVWTPNRSSYGYTFGKNKGLIKKLINYLDDGYDNGTKLDFLEYIGKIKSRVVNGKKEYRHSNSERFSPKSNWRGHFSSFFASAKNAGIIQYQKEGKDYIVKKGPNFEAFKSGELKPL